MRRLRQRRRVPDGHREGRVRRELRYMADARPGRRNARQRRLEHGDRPGLVARRHQENVRPLDNGTQLCLRQESMERDVAGQPERRSLTLHGAVERIFADDVEPQRNAAVDQLAYREQQRVLILHGVERRDVHEELS